METINYTEFSKVELRVAEVIEAEAVPNTDKLMRLLVDLGTEQRQLVAGIRPAYQPEQLVGRQVVVVVNLEPRTLRGVTSQGMVLAASNPEGRLAMLTVDKQIANGSLIR